MFRLSVIIPAFNRRADLERSIASVISQPDPIGIEVVVADDGSAEGLLEKLEDRFFDLKREGRLVLATQDHSGDLAKARNLGASKAQGSFLTFLGSGDIWLPNRATLIEPLLARHDLIVGVDHPKTRPNSVDWPADWIDALVGANRIQTSSVVIRRTVFEELGGFKEGYGGFPFPKKIPGDPDYEFWLNCMNWLAKTDRKSRVTSLSNESLQSSPQNSKLPGVIPLSPALQEKLQTLRELYSLVKVTPKLDRKHWGKVAKRIRGAAKGLLKPK